MIFIQNVRISFLASKKGTANERLCFEKLEDLIEKQFELIKAEEWNGRTWKQMDCLKSGAWKTSHGARA